MDRRRYVPVGEAMEVRTMLSGINVNNLFGFQVNSNLNVPITYQQKELRVERLAYYMGKILPGRYLPVTDTKQIAEGLTQLISKIQEPIPQVKNNFNNQLRKIIPKQSLTVGDVAILNRGYQAVLRDAHAPASAISTSASALYNLVTTTDTASPQPVYLGTNDYTIVLQTALAVGRPMPSPTVPQVAKYGGIQANVNHIKTHLKHPTVFGTYHFHTEMQVIGLDGTTVYGESPVKRSNKYRVTLTTPLTPGVHGFRLRAYDTDGNFSRESKAFYIKVIPRRTLPTRAGMATPTTSLTSK
jgi:hypothetical protein